MSDKLWKAVERKHAEIFKGKRIPVNSTDGAEYDVVSNAFSIESKERQSYPSWLIDAVSKIEARCKTGTLPIVILHEKGQLYDNDMVVIRLKHFRDYYI